MQQATRVNAIGLRNATSGTTIEDSELPCEVRGATVACSCSDFAAVSSCDEFSSRSTEGEGENDAVAGETRSAELRESATQATKAPTHSTCR